MISTNYVLIFNCTQHLNISIVQSKSKVKRVYFSTNFQSILYNIHSIIPLQISKSVIISLSMFSIQPWHTGPCKTGTRDRRSSSHSDMDMLFSTLGRRKCPLKYHKPFVNWITGSYSKMQVITFILKRINALLYSENACCLKIFWQSL